MKNIFPFLYPLAAMQPVVTGSVPEITQDPAGVTLNGGKRLTLQVEATGDPVPSFQWTLNGNLLSAQKSKTLVIDSVEAKDAGNYACIVSNKFGSVASKPATVVVVINAIIGEIYNPETLTLSDFNKYGQFTATVTGGKLAISGGSNGDFGRGLSLNAFEDADENHTMELEFQAGNNTGGFGVSKQTTNTYWPPSHGGYFHGPTGKVHLWCNSTGLIHESAQALSFAVGDVLILKLISGPGYLTATVKNTKNNTEVSTTSPVDFFKSTFIQANTSKFTINPCGMSVIVNRFVVSRQGHYGADLIVIGDSKSKGAGAKLSSDRFGMKIAAALDKTVEIWAGNGDRTMDQRKAVPSIIAAKPKNVLMCVGRNNLASGDQAQIEPDLVYMRNAFKAAGINVIHLLPIPESFSQSQISDVINQKFHDDLKIDASPGFDIATMIDDGVHPNNLGNQHIADKCIPALRAVI